MASVNSRRIIVLRHAKSDQDSSAATDHGRPLNPRGIRSAPAIGARLAELGWVPQIVISSDSTRTRETWAHMLEAIGGSPGVRFSSGFYLAGPTQVAAALRELPDDVHCAMVIGHNPGWEDLVYRLCGVRVRMTTCNAALLELEAEAWGPAIDRADWHLETVLRPKEL